MSDYGNFRKSLLLALHRKVHADGAKTYTLGEILQYGQLNPPAGWAKNAYGEFVEKKWIKGPYEGGPESQSSLYMTGYGQIEAERILADIHSQRPLVRLRSYLQNNLIAIAALLVSIVALFRSGS